MSEGRKEKRGYGKPVAYKKSVLVAARVNIQALSPRNLNTRNRAVLLFLNCGFVI